jgi:hypothetical protein
MHFGNVSEIKRKMSTIAFHAITSILLCPTKTISAGHPKSDEIRRCYNKAIYDLGRRGG